MATPSIESALNRSLALNAPQWINPYDAQIAAFRQQMAQPQTPMYSPEQVQQRQDENSQRYSLGLLGLLSGDEDLRGLGQQVFANALAARTPRVTELGVADPISGRFSYSPDYLREKDEQTLAGLESRRAQTEAQYMEARQRAVERADEQRQRSQDQRELRAVIQAGQGQPLVQALDANGQPVFVPRSQAVGMRPAPTGGGNPSEDERKAAGWLQQATNAYGQMMTIYGKSPAAAKPNAQELALTRISPDAAYAAMSPERQQFSTAASSFSEALLRAATGAGMNEYEAKQKVNELTPRYGEAPDVTMAKFKSAQNYIESLKLRAGRALPSNLHPSSSGTSAAPGRNFPKTLGGQQSNAPSQQARYVVDF